MSPVACRLSYGAWGHAPLRQTAAVDPETEGGIGDEINLLSVHGVVPVGEFRRVVFFYLLVVIGGSEPDTLDFGA